MRLDGKARCRLEPNSVPEDCAELMIFFSFASLGI